MSLNILKLLPLGLLVCSVVYCASGQCSIDWFTICSGGGTSTGTVYSASGTIGQYDAGGPLVGGNYSLISGFWSIFAFVPTIGPTNAFVSISTNPNGTVLISWPNASRFHLEQTAESPSGSWVPVTNTPVQVGQESQVTITPLAGMSFYRLRLP